MIDRSFWAGRRVFVTGHTGFKGGWLSLWLAEMGAEVHGYALSPPTSPSFFEVCQVADRIASHRIGDVRDHLTLAGALTETRPQTILHLAAQPLVRESYRSPLETFETNVMGTAHLLEAARSVESVESIVSVTTDKCYENREWVWPYRENEPLGGHDPYSSSKACAELVTSAYRRSFLAASGVGVATARAGNVIGGGDWASDRLVPDFLRAIDANQPLLIRSPKSIRPWQHVLEPVAGYLMLAEQLSVTGHDFAESWNFGPHDSDTKPVRWIVDRLCSSFPGASWRTDEQPNVHEAMSLRLDSSKANHRLGWHPKWRLDGALQRTIDWHRAWRAGSDMAEESLKQIRAYESAAIQ